MSSIPSMNPLEVQTSIQQLEPLEMDGLMSIPPPLAPSPATTRGMESELILPSTSPSSSSLPSKTSIQIQGNVISSPSSSLASPISPKELLSPSSPTKPFKSPPLPNTSFNATMTSAGQTVINMLKRRDPNEVMVGTPIRPDHVNYVLMYDMLTGIRIAVSRSMARPWREVIPEDYETAHKLAFDITGDELNPSSKYDFKFKDYAPWVFRGIRQASNIDASEYLISLTGRYVMSELGSPGKSGSFFYFSADYRYIIKTLYPKDKEALLSILPSYYKHICDNPETLVNRILGLHRVKLPGGSKIHFVVMENIFPPQLDVHETFDLKGSTYGRKLDPEKLKKNPRSTQKDVNWLEQGKHIWLGPQKRKFFLDQLARDVEFLRINRIMDYSLLVGIHDMKRGNADNIRDTILSVFDPNAKPVVNSSAPDIRKALAAADPIALGPAPLTLPEEIPHDRKARYFSQDAGGLLATDSRDAPLDEMYFFGVIDVLTIYTPTKRMETFVKGFYQNRQTISAVDPDYYASRFLEFMTKAVGIGPPPPNLIPRQPVKIIANGNPTAQIIQ